MKSDVFIPGDFNNFITPRSHHRNLHRQIQLARFLEELLFADFPFSSDYPALTLLMLPFRRYIYTPEFNLNRTFLIETHGFY